jgi:hypothetical protein
MAVAVPGTDKVNIRLSLASRCIMKVLLNPLRRWVSVQQGTREW